VDGILMGGPEIEQRLWMISFGLWDFCTIDAKGMRYSDVDWIKLAMNRVERVLL